MRNNYDKNVFNGDIGTVVHVDNKALTLTVLFDDRRVEYQANELDDISAAYAITIHKSQGSEFDIVVIPVVPGHRVMLQRNLIYTAITRAKKVCVLVGSVEALRYAIDRRPAVNRNTRLQQRLHDAMADS